MEHVPIFSFEPPCRELAAIVSAAVRSAGVRALGTDHYATDGASGPCHAPCTPERICCTSPCEPPVKRKLKIGAGGWEEGDCAASARAKMATSTCTHWRRRSLPPPLCCSCLLLLHVSLRELNNNSLTSHSTQTHPPIRCKLHKRTARETCKGKLGACTWSVFSFFLRAALSGAG